MRLITAFFALLISTSASAQKTSDSPFSVESAGGKTLRVSDIETEISVNGPFAESTLDVAYYNDSAAPLQGLFKIQLPQGALVRDFALRIGEKWHYGSLTEKHKARETFEEIVRAGADPAVLAWKDGAEYQVRIFPFPGKGKRWIRIHYWQDLQQSGNQFVYSLPLPKTKLNHFRLKFNAVAESLSAMKVGAAFEKHAYVKAGAEKNNFGSIVDEREFSVPGEFRVTFDQGARVDVWTGKAAPKGDTHYLAARFLKGLEPQPREVPKRVLLFVDTSRSAKPENDGLLKKFVQHLQSRLPKGTELSFYEFDAGVRKVAKLAPAVYDGGTDFKAVFEEIDRQQKKGAVDALILTDAVPTMQRESDLSTVPFGAAKVFMASLTGRFNPHFAALIAERSGGSVLPSLVSENWDSIYQVYATQPWIFKGAAVEGGSASEIFPEPGSAIDPDEGAYVYFRSKNGRLPKAVTVSVVNGKQTRELRADLSEAKTVAQTENLWAMKKLFSMAGLADENEKDLIAHAMRYKLVSPKTSYIVLENDWDYQRFNIAKRDDRGSEGEEVGLAFKDSEGFGESLAAEESAVSGKGEAKLTGAADSAAPQAVSAPQIRAKKSIAPSGLREAERERRRAFRFQTGENLKWTEATHRYSKAFWSLKQIRDLYAKASEENLDDAWFFIEIANALSANGEKEQAARVLSNLFEISEEDGKSLRALGLLGCFNGRCEWAVQAFKMAIDLRPEEPQNYRDLAWLYAEMGRLDDAKSTLGQLKGKKFHFRFPGMDELLNRESEFFAKISQAHSDVPETYTWITWNNDNSDADFHIEESKSSTVNYTNRKAQGTLTNDFTRGYGPEVYSAAKSLSPKYLVNYYRGDPSAANTGLVVKFALVERAANGKVKIQSKLFPLYHAGDFIDVSK